MFRKIIIHLVDVNRIKIYRNKLMKNFHCQKLDNLVALYEDRVSNNDFISKIDLFEKLAVKKSKPKVVKFKDGIVINGSFGSEEVDKILKPYLGAIPLIISDPPYSEIVKNDWDQGINADNYIQWAKDCLKYLGKGASFYCWGGIGFPPRGNKPGNRTFFEFLTRVEKEVQPLSMQNLITWSKKRAYGTAYNYLFTREECAWFVNGERPKIFHIPLLEKERGYAGFSEKYPAKSKYLRRTSIWTDVPELFSGKVHICQKPEKLSEIMILAHTKKGDTILDPFSGSGSVGKACRNLDRKFILIERDPKNFKIICNRLK